MPVTDVNTDLDNTTITITATFDAPVAKVWEMYSDPDRLAKVFGPPTHPATFEEHDLRTGGESRYVMTGPDGEKYHGVWKIRNVDDTVMITFDDHFADQEFEPVDDMPVSHNTYTFAENDTGSTVRFVTTFESVDDMRRMMDMGAVEGSTAAIEQIDEHL